MDDIQNHQDILLEAVINFLDRDKTHLLDGHFCLIDGDGYIQQVPIEVFGLLGLKKIIVITDYVKKISERLTSRDSIDYSLDFIKRFQERKISHARAISKQIRVPQIRVPLRIINISDEKIGDIFDIEDLFNGDKAININHNKYGAKR